MTSRTPLFSVLIANYNNGVFLEETLESIFNQSYTNWEIIIVDDDSKDHVSEKIYSNLHSNGRVKIFKNRQNRGCGFTKNKCVEYASGDLCGFVDPEDTLTPDAIESMVNAHLENNDISLVFSDYWICNSNLKPINLINPIEKEGYHQASQISQKLISHFASFKRSKYSETSGINKNLKRAVDQDLYIKLEEVGKIYHINKPIYYYRYHEQGISTHNNTFKSDYWYNKVRYDACIRRGIEPEAFFAKEIEKLMNTYRNTPQYKLGHLLFAPYRLVKKLWNTK